MSLPETIPQDRAAVQAVRSLPCPHCWAGAGGAAGEACGIIPAGDHLARWVQAYRGALVTSEQFGAALSTLTVITGAAMVVTP